MSVVTNIPDHVLALSPDYTPDVKSKVLDNSIPDIEGLKPQQRVAFDEMKKYVEDPNSPYRAILLEGYAGTGKTHTVVQLIKHIIMMLHAEVAVTAPTNKAVKVLRTTASYKHNLLIFKTIHSLLGLKEDVDDKGRRSFIADTDPENAPRIQSTAVLIIDEVSMLSDELFGMIDECIDKLDLKVIYMGDPAQIPPVGMTDSIPFNENARQKHKIKRLQLTEIVRQENGNPILELATCVRENLTFSETPYDFETKLVKLKGEYTGIVTIAREDKERLWEVCNHYFTNPRFAYDPDFMKVIAWTNKTVDWVNAKIRAMIYKEDLIHLTAKNKNAKLPKIMIGEKLIADSPIMSPEPDPITGRPSILFTTNDEFEIAEYSLAEINVFSNFRVSVYAVKAKYITEKGNTMYKKFDIVHESGEETLQQVMDTLQRRAIKEPDKAQRRSLWRNYYSVKNKFAQVKYNYAITAHKSQGSTYTNVITIDVDIDSNRNVVERNRIKYVSYTRARNLLFLVK